MKNWVSTTVVHVSTKSLKCMVSKKIKLKIRIKLKNKIGNNFNTIQKYKDILIVRKHKHYTLNTSSHIRKK